MQEHLPGTSKKEFKYLVGGMLTDAIHSIDSNFS